MTRADSTMTSAPPVTVAVDVAPARQKSHRRWHSDQGLDGQQLGDTFTANTLATSIEQPIDSLASLPRFTEESSMAYSSADDETML